MYEDRTKDNLQSEMLAGITDDIDKTVGSFIYDVTKPMAAKLEEVYQYLSQVVGKLNIDNLSDTELEQRVYELTGIERKQATYATGSVLVTGQVGAIVNIGDRFASDTLTYTALEQKTISGTGQVSVQIQCTQAGVIGNVPANSIKFMPITLTGIVSVTNQAPFSNGFDAESDDELKARFYLKIQKPATSGNKNHYTQWAKEVEGISDAKCFPIWNGPGTVKVVLLDENKRSPSTDVVTNVVNYIEDNRPVGATVTVIGATEVTINVTATLTLDSGKTISDVQQSIEDGIISYIHSLAFIDPVVRYSRIANAILDVDGVLDYSGLTVNGGTANITIADGSVAVFGVVTLS